MLKLLNGGKGPEPPSHFKKHYLHEDLWRALYPRPATSFDEIVERIGKSHHGPKPSPGRIASCLMHVRVNALEYGWTVPHVQKGRGDLRLYFVVKVDEDGSYVDDEYLDNMFAGLISSASTMATMAENEATALDIAAGLSIFTRGERKQLRSLSGLLLAMHETAAQILRRMEK